MPLAFPHFCAKACRKQEAFTFYLIAPEGFLPLCTDLVHSVARAEPGGAKLTVPVIFEFEVEMVAMPLRISHGGDFHLDEDHYFADTAQCIEWFIEDGIQQGTNLFVLNGDLTTYKQTIRERKFWVDAVIRMADHAPVLLIAGNHGKELENDLCPLGKVNRISPTRRMVELQAVYHDGELRLPDQVDLNTLKDSRVKVVVKVPNGPDRLLSREQQENLREKLLAAGPAELKVKIEHDADIALEPAPIAAAHSSEEKLRAYWALKGFPSSETQERLLAKLAEVEKVVLTDGQL